MRGANLRTWFWALSLFWLGVALCFVPLFDLLGYEACFALGLGASVAGAHIGATTVWQARAGAARSDRQLADAHPAQAVARWFWRSTATVWVLTLPPLFALTLNALHVRNCDYPGGLRWFAVLPLASAACGSAAGVAAGLLAGGARRRLWPTVLAFAILLASVLWAVWRFYATPAIFAYDPFGGYFPGTIYDEEVAIGAPLLWARVWHLTAAASALALCALFLDGQTLRVRLSASRGRTRLALGTLVLCALALTVRSRQAQLGFYLDTRDVQQALGAQRETPHFVLHYSPAGPFAKDLELYVADHEFRYAQLEQLLGVHPDGKVHAYLFDSAAQKQALMGAGHTFIAKPWRKEIYIQAEGWPHSVLMHELAHVFAGRFGDRIFGASRSGIGFNVGLIEGIAVAGAWHGGPLTPDEAVKSMREAKIEPPLARVMSMAFLGLNASQAYNVAGSFCHFLLENYGPRPLGRVFHEAGSPASWQAAYGVPFETLAQRWSQHIDAVVLPERESELMRERLKRPSVFHKVCAHELALKRESARKAASQGDRARSLAELESVCADDADDPQNLAEVMDAAHAAELPGEAARDAARLLAHPKVTAALQARAHALLGDLALQRGDRTSAATEYAAAERLPLDESQARLTTVKRMATAEPPGPVADALVHYLAAPQSGRDAALDLLSLGELVHAEPSRALFHYLLARQLEPRGRFAEAARELDRSLVDDGAGLPDARFVTEALRLLGRTRYRAGDLDGARAAFTRLRDAPSATASTRLEAADWLARIAFAVAEAGR
jgi:hypothetical protein